MKAKAVAGSPFKRAEMGCGQMNQPLNGWPVWGTPDASGWNFAVIDSGDGSLPSMRG